MTTNKEHYIIVGGEPIRARTFNNYAAAKMAWDEVQPVPEAEVVFGRIGQGGKLITMDTKRFQITCPGCGGNLRDVPASNATSRFVRGLYICNECGVREAFEGNFMRLNLRTVQKLERIQAKWIASQPKEETV